MKENYHPIKINFTDDEYKLISKYAKSCGMTMVELLRALLKNYHPKPRPDKAFRNVLNELYNLHESVKENKELAVKLRAIILRLQKETLLTERGEAIGGNKTVGN